MFTKNTNIISKHGRIGVGKVDNGTIAVNQDMVVVSHHDPDKQKKVKISKLYEFDGLQKVEVKEASIGAIVAISGISDISIGDTLCSPENPTPIPFQKISEPTISSNIFVILLFVFSQTNVPQGCPVRQFLTGRRVDWASGRLRSIFYSTTYLTFDSLRPSYFSCANSLSRNSDTSSMSSLSIKSSFINTSRSV